MRRAAIGLAVVCAAHYLIGADGLAVAITLPSVQSGFGVPAIDAQWTLTAYALAFGGALLLGGRLGDLYGRRRLLVSGMTLFALGSLLAALAPVLGVLITARAVQGLGSAAAVPAALALIGSIYPPGQARTRALSLLAAMASLGILTGLLFGGVVTDLLGWRWVFGVMTLPAVVTAIVAPRVLPEARATQIRVRLDIAGAALVSAGLAFVLLGLTKLEHGGIDALWPMVAGAVLLAAFVGWERRAPDPLIRFGILRVRSLGAASLGTCANGVGFTSIVYVGTLYLQSALGWNAMTAALALIPLDGVAVVVSLAAARPLARRSPRAVLAVSTVLIGLSLLWLARAPVPANFVVDLLVPLVVLGAALPAIFLVVTHAAVADIEPDDKGLASGIFETSTHLIGGAAGVAIYATVLSAAGYGPAFLTAAGLVTVLGTAAVFRMPRTEVIAHVAPAGRFEHGQLGKNRGYESARCAGPGST